ncbi:pectate lyase superfamily protein [Emydomyces testavorans]|uniref:Pectate lyase superfamily protein n=1 Tax=Emydomyces testavorans TaxID=2070801 RepID=A0AAF0IE63_9EURO|nr:pectate lyase superfamily protein [Emydomyces testavorans]
MARKASVSLFIAQLLLLLLCSTPVANAVPMPQAQSPAPAADYWLASIKRQGKAAFNTNGNYQVFRNVKEFGAKGDGSTDDTEAINNAISSGGRCGLGCDSSTVTPALIYFPSGTYVVSKPIIQYYYSQFVGDAVHPPVLKAASNFAGMAVIDADPYTDQGNNWYTNQNNFFRQIRNFVIDLTGMDKGAGAGIHWQVAQATSLQNIRFEMVRGGGDANKQMGIFMDNGSGGFMSDLVFNGGNYGAFLGSQQFTTRNMTFNDCNTAVFMNWNWAWTFKSLSINNCGVGLNMSNGITNQTVGSVLILDSKISQTPKGVVTAFNSGVPATGGTLILDNVDFSGSQEAVMGVNGETIVGGNAAVKHWVQGNAYIPGSALGAPKLKRNAFETKTVTYEKVVTVYDCPSPLPSPGASSPVNSSPQVPSTAGPTRTLIVTIPTPPSSNAPSSNAPSSNAPSSNAPGSNAPGSSETSKIVPSQTSVSLPPVPTPSQSATNSASKSGGTCASTPVTKTRVQTQIPAPTKPTVLLDQSGKVFERTKPQYENVPASSFISVKSAGAKGDGNTDDTAAIQQILDNAKPGQIVYFDHGAYLITKTIKVPKNIKITGEIWPLLMATGPAFSDEKNPIPMLQVGQPGDKGVVEISDLILETKGPTPGAILVEWNIHEETQGSVGMWDVHFRVGGSAGTELQSDHCAKTPNSTTTPDPKCIGAFMLLHLTESASGYFENTWFWVSDHELDRADHGQINIYNGRGVLIESQGPVWLYGTASEHNTLYNYQINDAKNVYMAMIQTETPYFQSNPDALVPFKPNPKFKDPTFDDCTTASCKKAWGLRVVQSSDVFLYGGGLYSFFENYRQECLQTESCQLNMVDIDCSQVYLYGLSTKASTNMITSGGQGVVLQKDNRNNFCSTLAFFRQGL